MDRTPNYRHKKDSASILKMLEQNREDREKRFIELKEERERNRATKMDEIEAFFYSMGQATKKLPLQIQCHIKMKVYQAVAEGEMEYLTPVQHNNPPISELRSLVNENDTQSYT